MKKKYLIIIMSISLAFIAGTYIFIRMIGYSSTSVVTTIGEKNSNSYSLSVSIPYDEKSQQKRWVESDSSIGAQYDIVVSNDTDYSLSNWEIKLNVPENSYIDSCWDCKCDINNTTLSITPLDYNTSVFSDDERKLGFILYTPKEYAFSTASINGTVEYNYKASPLYILVISSFIVWCMSFIIICSIKYRLRFYKRIQRRDRKIITQAINTFVNFIDAKDPYTRGHSARVAIYSKELARRMKLTDDEQQNLYYIALMHDVGKIGISDSILNKTGALTPEEKAIIESHTIIGGEMLKSFTAINGIVDGALSHHERYDGKGYPKGLKGNEISLYARIICVADSYDAMSTNRCYRKSLSKEAIFKELDENAGTQFDPDIVIHMIDMINDGFTLNICILNDEKPAHA